MPVRLDGDYDRILCGREGLRRYSRSTTSKENFFQLLPRQLCCEVVIEILEKAWVPFFVLELFICSV